MENTRHTKIPPELMALYLARKITSAQLAEKTGYHAVYLRRSIKREPRPPRETKTALSDIRKSFHKSLAHLPIDQIMKQGSVSESTAARIKKRYSK